MVSLKQTAGAVTFNVKVHPRARKSVITGDLGGTLKLSITTPPIGGRANAACIDFLAKLLRVSRSSVTLVSGEASRQKVIRVAGLSVEELQTRLASAQGKNV